MNLAALRTEVLGHGFDANQYSARITQYLNDAQGLVCRRVDYFLDEAVMDYPTVAGTNIYPQPANLGRDRSLRDTSVNRELTAVSVREIDRSRTASGPPRFYAIDGLNLHLYPTPDSVYPLELRYWSLPAPLVNDPDTPTIPENYHRMLWYWATKECYAADDDQPTAQYWETQFNTVLSEFAADVKFPNDDLTHQLSSMWSDPSSLSAGTGLISG